MMYIVGLGNTGKEYENSRHNAGRMAVFKLLKDLKLIDSKKEIEDLEFNKKANALIASGSIDKEKITAILPETFMNNSGKALLFFIKPILKPTSTKTSPKKKSGIPNLIVIYDDIDLAIGTMKISYNKGTGGHRGLDSIVKTLKTKEFLRIRIGISPATPKGKIKKPEGEQKVLDFILGRFKSSEMETLDNTFKKVTEAVKVLIKEGRDKAMNLYN